ncbi:hypothetical protein [Croceicoccus mobilis]|uniref:hypothetical protein n=1 Tax=Croceicoccus mobilis TaxID=1703339 RepID=UPI0012E76A97|nr:hypothetical protein [Croceicoccus mobilis]
MAAFTFFSLILLRQAQIGPTIMVVSSIAFGLRQHSTIWSGWPIANLNVAHSAHVGSFSRRSFQFTELCLRMSLSASWPSSHGDRSGEHAAYTPPNTSKNNSFTHVSRLFLL